MLAFPVIFARRGVAVPVYETEATALFAAMTTPPDATRKGHINTLIAALKGAGVWSNLGVLYVFAAADAQAALLNWKNPAGTPALATNSPTFTADRGYAGDGVSAFIDTQQPWNAIPGVALDNAHFGAYARGLGATSNLAGIVNANGVSIVRAASQLQTGLNTGVSTTAADAWATTSGTHAVISRSSAPSYDRYLEGVAQSPAAVASTVLPTANMCALRRANSYANSNGNICGLHAGSALTAGEALATRNAIQTYMAAVGAS